MVCYPEVQKEAQAELDKVLNGRLPEHSDFPSLPPYLSALVKEVYRYAAVCFEYLLLHVNFVTRWNPVLPMGRSLFLSSMMVTSWNPYLFKASHTSQPAMISTMTIISPPTLLWFLTNGDSPLPLLNFELSLFLRLYSIGRCWMTNESIQNRANSSPNAFWRMENSTVQLETPWTLHLVSEGGGDYLYFPCLVWCHYYSGRICPGRHIAHSTLTLAAASVLSSSDLVRKVDENGREIEPKKEYIGAGIR